jgi:membrane protein
MVTLGTIILAASLSLTAHSADVTIIRKTLEIGLIQRLVEFITPYFITSIFLAFVYKFIPNTLVRIRPAIVGGVVGGVLWEFSKNLYVYYVTEMLKGADVYVKVYSGMAAVPLFLLWVYLSWIIFLLGAEVAFAVQNTETYRLERKAKGMSQRYRDILSLRVMLLAARYFASGRTGPNLEGLAAETQAPVRILNDITYDLCHVGLLVETAHPERRFAPAVPLDSFTPHTVMTRLRQLGRTPPPDRDAPDFDIARDILERSEAANADLFRSCDFATLAKSLGHGSSDGETAPNGRPA